MLWFIIAISYFLIFVSVSSSSKSKGKLTVDVVTLSAADKFGNKLLGRTQVLTFGIIIYYLIPLLSLFTCHGMFVSGVQSYGSISCSVNFPLLADTNAFLSNLLFLSALLFFVPVIACIAVSCWTLLYIYKHYPEYPVQSKKPAATDI